MSHGTIGTKVNQIAARFGVEEARAYHPGTRIAAELIRKRFFGFPKVGVYQKIVFEIVCCLPARR